MRILQVISSSATSGAERHVLSLSKRLIERGHQVSVVCPDEGWLPVALGEAGVAVYPSQMKGRGWARTLGLVLRHSARHRADVVHTHLTRAAYIGFAAGLIGRKPVVTSVHIANNDQIYKRLARGRNRLVAVSQYVSGMLHGRGIPERYIDMVYNGTDFIDFEPDEAPPVKEEFSIPKERRLVGLVGRVCREKGHLELIEAFGRVRREHPDAHIVFVGRVVETFADELNEAIDRSGLAPHLTMTGVRHDVPRLLDSFTLTTMPSHVETFGVAAIEAMARGKAVVANRVGGLMEVVRHRQTGLLVDLRPEALADAVSYLLAHDEERERMGRSGRRLVAQRFTVAEMVRRMESVYAHAQGLADEMPPIEALEGLAPVL
ncbi:MAG: glycosyltransferase family 4 protein [Fimbriimonas ginsengisoli]|uniref:Glycosyltransferase family 4 protein n=1 Tax=Fimbriimonas ginsengisoli TaxID=1005039 RepID=A0A931LY24_FIMGI|nr:glycosyltransferase family 4 protein [Fimbriimonas ginsengisoli]